MPPILEAKGIPRMIAFLNGSLPGKVFTTGIATAIISAVVAVLEIHIERKADMTITPSRTAAGLFPTLCSSFFKSHVSMPYRLTAWAITNPPSRSTTTELKNGFRKIM
jgi:hypothetical protein